MGIQYRVHHSELTEEPSPLLMVSESTSDNGANPTCHCPATVYCYVIVSL